MKKNDNVKTGIPKRLSSCPGDYVTLHYSDGFLYLKVKNKKRARAPNKYRMLVQLPRNYRKALKLIDEHLTKQLLTRMTRMQKRMRKNIMETSMDKIPMADLLTVKKPIIPQFPKSSLERPTPRKKGDTQRERTAEEVELLRMMKLIEPKLRYGGCLRHDQLIRKMAEIAESKVECLKRGMDYVSDEDSMSRTNQDAEDDEDDFIPPSFQAAATSVQFIKRKQDLLQKSSRITEQKKLQNKEEYLLRFEREDRSERQKTLN
ncbi:hypothetical protein IFM89_017048 [Coptis chinensis]|uniref:Uncharacterized protein n=1 Tax=Coptis chinensis TaxID=261450 RepID=A0A835HN82_9MAGN|nr:hypothetical protein IFM89_017048 [Coptis chinensis]